MKELISLSLENSIKLKPNFLQDQSPWFVELEGMSYKCILLYVDYQYIFIYLYIELCTPAIHSIEKREKENKTFHADEHLKKKVMQLLWKI